MLFGINRIKAELHTPIKSKLKQMRAIKTMKMFSNRDIVVSNDSTVRMKIFSSLMMKLDFIVVISKNIEISLEIQLKREPPPKM